MMGSTILEFREKFSFNPNLYLDKTEDTEEWDTSFHFDKLDEIWDTWQNPEEADPHHKMES